MNLQDIQPNALRRGDLPEQILRKVYGKPLQDLYAKIIRQATAPAPPDLIRALSQFLKRRGLNYHPRTLKRQLLGNIEYVPEALEDALVHWVESQKKSTQQKFLREFRSEKKSLEKSQDKSLYVAPHFFIRLADGYLYLNKHLSRRKLALQLRQDLADKKTRIGLETLQAALAGKPQKIRKVIEDQLLEYFHAEGFKTKPQIESFLDQSDQKGKQEIKKVEVGNIGQLIDAYLFKAEGISKRQLALKLQELLKAKGYAYHLSSIQSVLEGKTKKTKQAILETLNDLLREEGLSDPGNLKELIQSVPPGQLEWHHYVEADAIPEMVQKILSQNPTMTRRRLASMLRQDLVEKKFNFSLNTLQYILAGKTKRTRKIVFELLGDYQKPGILQGRLANAKTSWASRKGRPSLGLRVAEAYEKLQNATEAERDSLLQIFKEIRLDLIRKRWAALGRKRYSRGPAPSPREGFSEEKLEEMDFSNFDRLVS